MSETRYYFHKSCSFITLRCQMCFRKKLNFILANHVALLSRFLHLPTSETLFTYSNYKYRGSREKNTVSQSYKYELAFSETKYFIILFFVYSCSCNWLKPFKTRSFIQSAAVKVVFPNNLNRFLPRLMFLCWYICTGELNLALTQLAIDALLYFYYHDSRVHLLASFMDIYRIAAAQD